MLCLMPLRSRRIGCRVPPVVRDRLAGEEIVDALHRLPGGCVFGVELEGFAALAEDGFGEAGGGDEAVPLGAELVGCLVDDGWECADRMRGCRPCSRARLRPGCQFRRLRTGRRLPARRLRCAAPRGGRIRRRAWTRGLLVGRDADLVLAGYRLGGGAAEAVFDGFDAAQQVPLRHLPHASSANGQVPASI